MNNHNHTAPNSCPTCGQSVAWHGTWTPTQALGLPSGASPIPNSQIAEWSRRRPVGQANYTTNLGLPIAKALVASLISAGVTIPVCIASLNNWIYAWPFVGATFAIAWFTGSRFADNALFEIETVFSHDPQPAPAPAPPPPPPPSPVTLEATIKDTHGHIRRTWIDDLPQGIDTKTFSLWCDQILLGKSMAQSRWTGSGKLFDKQNYIDMIALLEQKNLIRLRNPEHPAQGYTLTNSGTHTLKGWQITRTHAHART